MFVFDKNITSFMYQHYSRSLKDNHKFYLQSDAGIKVDLGYNDI